MINYNLLENFRSNHYPAKFRNSKSLKSMLKLMFDEKPGHSPLKVNFTNLKKKNNGLKL